MFATGEAWTAVIVSVVPRVLMFSDTFWVGELNDVFTLKDVHLLDAGYRVDLHSLQAVL